MKKIAALLIMCCILVFGSVASAASGANFDANRVEADGYGVEPDNAGSAVQARLMARRAAIADAQRNLAEQIAGVQVNAETTVRDMQLASDVVTTRVSAVLKGAKVIEESYEDGAYHVVLALPVFGARNSLASVVLPSNPVKTEFPKALTSEPEENPYAPEYTPETTIEPTTHRVSGTYTGIIVDCTGLGLRTAMSPVIKTTSGEAIYGYKNLDSKKVIKNGMAGYAKNINGNVSRAGSNPLIVRAVGVDRYFNPVLSVADAKMVLEENELTHFLDNTAVVFIH